MCKCMKCWLCGSVLAALLVIGYSALASEEGWTVDFAAAKKVAAESNKDIFMEFTGSDWCPPCIAMNAEILSTDAFKNEAPSTFVLLKLDNPKKPENVAKQPAEEKAQYQKLAAEYGVRGVPTVFLADATGKPYAKNVGYMRGGNPATFLEGLKKLQQLRVKRDENLKKSESAQGVEQAKLLDAAIGGIDAVVLATYYKPQVEQIIALDADGSAGLKDIYTNVLNATQIDQQIDQAMNAGPNGAASLDTILAGQNLPASLKQKAMLYKGFMLMQTDKVKASETLQAAIEVKPDAAFTVSMINQILTQIKAEASQTPPAK